MQFGTFPKDLKIEKTPSSIVVITDEHLATHYLPPLKEHLPCQAVIIPPGEKEKSLETACQIWQKLQSFNLDRNALIIALGGGVITDLAGFVASTFLRGLRLISIPTTLLAMVDAAIGGKNGVNLKEGKNRIGTFYFPDQIFIAPHLLKTLPKREFLSGLAEVIKYGVIADPSLFHTIESTYPDLPLQKIIQSCVTIKQVIVEKDPHDHHLRHTLNYGHTFGHALETLTHYNRYTHGEAISIGMHLAASFGHFLGITPIAFLTQQQTLFETVGLPVTPPPLSAAALLEALKQDKKNKRGSYTFILPKTLGQVQIHSTIDEETLTTFVATIAENRS